MNELIEKLNNGKYSCVIKNQNQIRTFTKRGVADLFDLHENDKSFLQNSFIADKVIGKAAAALIISGEVKSIYTKILSSQALDLFKKYNYIMNPSERSERSDGLTFETEVHHIINRDKTDWCPLEKLCYNENSVEKIIEIIRIFIANLNKD